MFHVCAPGRARGAPQELLERSGKSVWGYTFRKRTAASVPTGHNSLCPAGFVSACGGQQRFVWHPVGDPPHLR